MNDRFKFVRIEVSTKPVNRYRTRIWDLFNSFLSPTNLATPDLSTYFPRLTNGWLIEHVGFPPQKHQCNIAQSQFKANHSKLQSLPHVSWNLYKAEDRLVLMVVFFPFLPGIVFPCPTCPWLTHFPKRHSVCCCPLRGASSRTEHWRPKDKFDRREQEFQMVWNW